jgi:hypothetical protein
MKDYHNILKLQGKKICFFSMLILLILSELPAQYHVTLNGSPEGDGSFENPWDIQTAFKHPVSVEAGDTIWLHEGVYDLNDRLISNLSGSEGAPIIVRQYPKEIAVINTGDDVENALQINGEYTWYWGFQVTSSASGRESDPEDNYHPHRGKAINIGQSDDKIENPGIKCINLIVHNTAGGFGIWTSAVDGEIYGCIVFHNGYDGGAWHDPKSYRGHGHCIYSQSDTRGIRYLKDNILFWGYAMAIHAYTSSSHLDNMSVEGNIIFNPGLTSTISDATEGIHIGGVPVAKNPYIAENYVYMTPSMKEGDACNLTEPDSKWWGGVRNSEIQDNYFVSGDKSLVMYERGEASISGNTFVGDIEGFNRSAFSNNNYYLDEKPQGIDIFIRPNEYESGRAHICVFNWDNLSSTKIYPEGILKQGQEYALYDVQNLSGDPLISGDFNGSSITVPLINGEAMQAVGGMKEPINKVKHTSPEFNVFLLVTGDMSRVKAKELR